MNKELENLIASFYKWSLRKNMLATKDNNFPLVVIYDSPYVNHISFQLRKSTKQVSMSIGTIEDLQIRYGTEDISRKNIIKYKYQIKCFIKEYLRIFKEITTYKFTNINKACIDIIDNTNVYLNKEKNVSIKSILSKTEVIDYEGNIYKLSDLYIRYL